MDFSVFSTTPVISACVILFLFGALLGHLTGAKKESDKKQVALAQAEQEKTGAISRLSSEHEEKVRSLTESNSNEIEKLTLSHQNDNHQLIEAHQKLVDSLKAGHLQDTERANLQHGNLIVQLNDTNLNNTRELQRDYENRITRLNQDNGQAVEAAKQEHVKEIQTIKSEAASTLDIFRSENARAMSLLQDENQKNVQIMDLKHQNQLHKMEAENQTELENLRNKISDLNLERTKLQNTVAQLEEKIKDDRKNNTFSMSKSGDRLMSVVRSVQELANELETTSKTVTAGEYSVFNELRDHRKQEKILSLGDDGDESEESGDTERDTDSTVDRNETDGGEEHTEEKL